MNYFYDVTNGFNFFISEIYQNGVTAVDPYLPASGSYVIQINGTNRALYKRVGTGSTALPSTDGSNFELIVNLSQLENLSIMGPNKLLWINSNSVAGLGLTRDGINQINIQEELVNGLFTIVGKTNFEGNQRVGEVFNDYLHNHATAESSHAEGASTTASARGAHAEGVAAKADGYASHAEGYHSHAVKAYSHVEGNDTTAYELCSHAEGDNTKAEGAAAHSEGKSTTAYGPCSHAEGLSTEASGSNSHTEGRFTIASGDCSHAEGRSYMSFYQAKEDTSREIDESDPYSILIDHMVFDNQPSGYNNVYSFAGGTNSHVEGGNTIALTSAAHAEGYGSRACGPHSHAEGHGSVTMYCVESGGISESKSFGNHAEGWKTQAGILVADSSGAHAEGYSLNNYELIKINNLGQSQSESKNDDIISLWSDNKFTLAARLGSHAEGENTLALETCSHTEGHETIAKGKYAHAEGYKTRAGDLSAIGITMITGEGAHAEGYSTNAHGNGAHAEGYDTTATGIAAHAEGRDTSAVGNYTHASGYGTKISTQSGVAIGQFNDESDSRAGGLFYIGNGVEDSLRRNAFRVSATGECYNALGTYTSGADYAEYFEWWQMSNQDNCGLFVTLNQDKIHLSNENDKVLGIISATPSVIGDSASEEWHNKYLRDVFGRIQYHNVLVPAEKDNDGNTIIEEHYEKQPILNPEYDPTREYISREHRPEWAPVGLLGKLVLIDDGTCVPGGYCKPSHDGIGTYSEEETNCYCMKRLDETHVKVMLK